MVSCDMCGNRLGTRWYRVQSSVIAQSDADSFDIEQEYDACDGCNNRMFNTDNRHGVELEVGESLIVSSVGRHPQQLKLTVQKDGCLFYERVFQKKEEQS